MALQGVITLSWNCDGGHLVLENGGGLPTVTGIMAPGGVLSADDVVSGVGSMICIISCELGCGLGAFLRWWSSLTMRMRPYYFYGHHWRCLNNPVFLNLGLYAVCWAHFMCHDELWPTWHPFSFLNNSLGFAGGKHYQKITIPIFRPVLQNFSRLLSFYTFCYPCYFSCLSSDWVVLTAHLNFQLPSHPSLQNF